MSEATGSGARQTVGKVLWVVSCVALALVVANLVGALADVDALDLPGPALLYVALLVATSAGSKALLADD